MFKRFSISFNASEICIGVGFFDITVSFLLVVFVAYESVVFLIPKNTDKMIVVKEKKNLTKEVLLFVSYV